MPPLRSLLFVPGNRRNMVEKARNLPADVLMLDLEDSVPVAEKDSARLLVRDAVPGLPLKGQQVYVRVNSLASGLAEADLENVLGQGVHGVSFGKSQSAQDIQRFALLVETLERKRGVPPGQTRLIPWIETAQAILHVLELATASPRIIGLAFGAEDFTLDMGTEPSPEGLAYPRAVIPIAARAAGVLAFDAVYRDLKDLAGLTQDAQTARKLGYDGKFLIHPDQIEPVHRVFTPSAEEVANARKVVKAFQEAEAKGWASTSLDGKMVDIPVVQRARNLLALAEAIASKETLGHGAPCPCCIVGAHGVRPSPGCRGKSRPTIRRYHAARTSYL